MLRPRERRFISDILQWYSDHSRDLPWRKTRDPYRILVSEVMLQQTQVDRVISKYKEFIRQFSTAARLAQARPADVIKAWKGLGYNRRALFLQRTAQIVCREYGGVFPREVKELKKLPGVGEYTARAVLAFAFLSSVSVLDTNHRKFYRRFLFAGKQVSDAQLIVAADELVQWVGRKTTHNVYIWNQAIMDFMTAVAQNNSHSLVQRFVSRYPDQSQKKRVGSGVPFRETNRFVRGRIIDYLRDAPSLSTTKLYRMFPSFSEDRLRNIMAQLEKDGLIKRKKQSIVLI